MEVHNQWHETRQSLQFPSSNSLFMGNTIEHNKLCNLHGTGPLLFMFFAVAIVLAHLLDEPCIAILLEDKEIGNQRGKEFHQIKSFLNDDKNIKLNCLIRTEEVVEITGMPNKKTQNQ